MILTRQGTGGRGVCIISIMYQCFFPPIVTFLDLPQGLASVLLSHIGLSESLAYILNVHASMMEWQPVEEPGYNHLLPDLCCRYTRLPPMMVRAMHDEMDLRMNAQ